MARILLVEDDDTLRPIIQGHLAKEGYRTETAPDAYKALEILSSEPQDLVLSDLNLPGMSGLELLQEIRAGHPRTTVVMMTAFGTLETAVAAIKMGSFDYLLKPVSLFDLSALVSKALEHLLPVGTAGSEESYGFEDIIGSSKALHRVLRQAARVAKTNANVLIQGETGTGKGVLAQAIHRNSLRCDKPFISINSGAIPRELLESELFGHVRGAFTGAVANKRGKVELANGGTLFLDEIGELSLDLQVRLLRLIQEREVDKVGSVHPTAVDVRIIAATHRNLQELVEAGTFREDLFYRLLVVPLELPPLRERAEDIPEFVNIFLDSFKARYEKPRLSFPLALMPYFTAYAWPGNVRELENCIERIVVLSRGDKISVEDLPDVLRAVPRRPVASAPTLTEGIGLADLERDLILQALERFGWNQSRAARFLNVSRKTLIYRLAKHGIDKKGA